MNHKGEDITVTLGGVEYKAKLDVLTFDAANLLPDPGHTNVVRDHDTGLTRITHTSKTGKIEITEQWE